VGNQRTLALFDTEETSIIVVPEDQLGFVMEPLGVVTWGTIEDWPCVDPRGDESEMFFAMPTYQQLIDAELVKPCDWVRPDSREVVFLTVGDYDDVLNMNVTWLHAHYE
jgi:hypothetical protein